MATKADRYEGIDGLKAYAIIGIALIRHIIIIAKMTSRLHMYISQIALKSLSHFNCI